MANEHTKKYSASLVNREMHKTTARNQYKPIKCLRQINKLKITNANESTEQPELSYTGGGNVKWYRYFEKQWIVSYKVKHSTI